MSVRVCSLGRTHTQTIPADGAFHLIRFAYYPYEYYDAWGMHQTQHPDGYQVTSWYYDDHSALIWPSHEGWGVLSTKIDLAPGDYTEVRTHIIRDPLGASPDDTGNQDHPTVSGENKLRYHHAIFVAPSTPLALRVRHNGASDATVTYAELKLAIHPVATP